MAMRPKKVEKSEPPFFADSPMVSPGKRTRATVQESRLNRPASPAASPASVARAKVNSGSVRSPGAFLAPRAPKAKAKSEREKLIAQEVRRSSVIQRDESIGMELMDAPAKRTSRSGEDDDFFAEMDHADGFLNGVSYGSYGKGGVSSASETPTFAQSPTEDEMVREAVSTGSRISRVSRSPLQTSIFSSDEDSSPQMMPREAPKLPKPQITKRTSASFLSESEDSPVDARRRFPAKFQEAAPLSGHVTQHVEQSEPLRRQLFQEDFSRATQSASLGSGAKFPPEDVTLTFEPLVLEEKEPQVAPESESDEGDAILSQDMDELPQVIIPEDPGSPQAGREDRDKPRSLQSKSELEFLPVLKVTPSPDVPPLAFSPDVKGRAKDLSSTSASTCTPSGESRFMASPSASELSRAPWNEDQTALKQQLEELEEQQKQIQSGLKEALQHHRRLWADELQRCQETSKELEKALEDERQKHKEQIKEWERRLQSELTKKESQWREEVDALVKEVDRLRQRCREHLQRKPEPKEPKATATVATSCDEDVASMMDLLSQQLQPQAPQQDPTSLSATTSTKVEVEKVETPKQVRISELAQEVSTDADLTLPIGAAREARLEASSTFLPVSSAAAYQAPYQAPLGAVSELWATAKASSQLEETLPAPRQARQALSAFSSPMRDRKSPSSSPVGLEFPSPVLVPQDGTPSNSPLKRIKPKVTSFLDATPIGPPLPSFTPSVWTPEDLNARAYSRSPRGLTPESPWTPTLHLSVERSPVARFPSAQVPTEPVAQACGSPSANADYLRFGPNAHFEAPKSWRRDGFEPSLM